MVEDLKRQQSTLRGELCSTQRVLEQLNSSRKTTAATGATTSGSTNISSKQWYNSKYYPEKAARDDGGGSPESTPYANVAFASREGESGGGGGGSISALEMSPSVSHKNY